MVEIFLEVFMMTAEAGGANQTNSRLNTQNSLYSNLHLLRHAKITTVSLGRLQIDSKHCFSRIWLGSKYPGASIERTRIYS
ncbi:hypothetical protein N7507_002691 [Penicillium longicatenatum]|nr:hypothetical protein N7507_002691 [Penicillium longicatenatum]